MGKFSKTKIFKNLFLRNCLLYEADTLHYVSGIDFYKAIFYFCSIQIRTLVAMATFSLQRFIMGKVEIFAISFRIFEF